MSGPLCGVAVVAFDVVRCGAADLLSIAQALAWEALRCLRFWLYESLAHWLVAAQLCERCPQKNTMAPTLRRGNDHETTAFGRLRPAATGGYRPNADSQRVSISGADRRAYWKCGMNPVGLRERPNSITSNIWVSI